MKKCISLLAVLFVFVPCKIKAEEQKPKEGWNLKTIRQVFMTSPPWVDELWNREQEDIESVTKSACANLRFFYNFYGAFTVVASREDLNWKDIKVMTSDIALHILSEQSRYAAMLLLTILDIPQEERRKAASCDTIIPQWNDGITLTSIIVEVLKNGFNSPLSIGVTRAQLQEKMLNDIRAAAERLGEEALKNEAAIPQFQNYLKAAIKNYNFTAKDLTNQQLAKWSRFINGVLPATFWQ